MRDTDMKNENNNKKLSPLAAAQIISRQKKEAYAQLAAVSESIALFFNKIESETMTWDDADDIRHFVGWVNDFAKNFTAELDASARSIKN
jgi:protease II